MKTPAFTAFVYMLRCADGSLYTGWTTDVQRRLAAHNAGKGAKYTRSRLPVTLAFVEGFADASDARKREYAIKALHRDAKLALIDANPVSESQTTGGPVGVP